MNDDEWPSDDDSGRQEECLLMSDASVLGFSVVNHVFVGYSVDSPLRDSGGGTSI
jgi:hypothetical protein